jgi:multisubunit Na+/H+ antiporter MnhG subunit
MLFLLEPELNEDIGGVDGLLFGVEADPELLFDVLTRRDEYKLGALVVEEFGIGGREPAPVEHVSRRGGRLGCGVVPRDGRLRPLRHPLGGRPVSAMAFGLGGLSALVLVLCGLGTFVMPTSLDRLHYLGPASTVGTAALAMGAALELGPSRAALKVVVLAVFLAGYGAVVVHAVGAAAHCRRERTT